MSNVKLNCVVESRVDELGPRYSFNIEDAHALKAKRLSELGEIVYHYIETMPFAVEHYGVMMGLIPSKHGETVVCRTSTEKFHGI